MRLIDADALQSEYMRYHDGKRIVLVDVAPTIEPEPQWIPCSERMPEHSGYYLVSHTFTDDGDAWVKMAWYSSLAECWRMNEKPHAWMPLPEPYKEDTDE